MSKLSIPLDRDLVFFDLETTGLHVLRDRILQIALVKYPASGADSVEYVSLVDPVIPISAESMAIHGITPDKLRGQPKFSEIAHEIHEFIGDADLSGYNINRFDVPMLMEEFARAGIDWNISSRRLIDVQRIFYKMEPRTLRAALKFYCGKELEFAHDALADVKATVDVLEGQIKKYEETDFTDAEDIVWKKPIRPDIEAIHKFTNDTKVIDVTQRLRYNDDGIIVFNFGRYINQPAAETLSRDKNYLDWMLKKDFSHQVKQIIRKLVSEYESENS